MFAAARENEFMAAKRRAKGNVSIAKRPGLRDRYIGSRLQLARYGRGMSQEHISKPLGISIQQLQKYESGQNRVSATRLYEIAKLLDVPISFFFEGIEQVPDTPLPPVERKPPLREFAPLLTQLVEEADRPRVLKLLRLKDLNEPDEHG